MPKIHSPEVSDAILKLVKSCNAEHLVSAKPKALYEAVADMGPGCLFDDFANEEQVKGALIVFNWLQVLVDAEVEHKGGKIE